MMLVLVLPSSLSDGQLFTPTPANHPDGLLSCLKQVTDFTGIKDSEKQTRQAAVKQKSSPRGCNNVHYIYNIYMVHKRNNI